MGKRHKYLTKMYDKIQYTTVNQRKNKMDYVTYIKRKNTEYKMTTESKIDIELFQNQYNKIDKGTE